MKTLCLTFFSITYLSYVCCNGAEPVKELKWTSPNKEHTIIAKPSTNDRLDIFTALNGSLIPMREVSFVGSGKHKYSGTSWLRNAAHLWAGETTIVFQQDASIAIMDAESHEVLLNNRFEHIAKEPGKNCWALIKYRYIERHIEQLPSDYRDKILIIDLQEDSFRSIVRNTAAQEKGDLPLIELEGIAVTEPIWASKGNSFLVNVSLADEVYGFVYGKNLRERERFMLNMKLTKDQTTSLKLESETRKKVISRMISVVNEGLIEEFKLR
jgi:hypothetical protein